MTYGIISTIFPKHLRYISLKIDYFIKNDKN